MPTAHDGKESSLENVRSLHVDFAVGETFAWSIQGGTGAYRHLTGSGQGSTIPNDDPNCGNTNTYTGFLVG